MKYLKTFESYSSVNEEFLGLDKIYNKLKGALSAWKDRRTKATAEKIAKLMDDKKDDPKFKEALENVKKAAANLSEEDKNKISKFSQGEIPEVVETPIKESSDSWINSFLKITGLSTGAFGLFSSIFTLLKITGAIAGSTVFGMYIGTALLVFVGLMAAGGIIGVVGAVRSENDSAEERSRAAGERLKNSMR
jgi:hypothetical protein